MSEFCSSCGRYELAYTYIQGNLVCRICWLSDSITIRRITILGHDLPKIVYDEDGFRKEGYEKK